MCNRKINVLSFVYISISYVTLFIDIDLITWSVKNNYSTKYIKPPEIKNNYRSRNI